LNKDRESLTYWQEIEARMYESIDAAFAHMAAQAPRRTLSAFVSDHGAKANGGKCNPGAILVQAGLTVLTAQEDPSCAANWAQYSGRKQVDWAKTRAVANGSCYVWVNLKGRDPHGSVEPEDYEKVQNEIIKALYDYTDPETGLKPIAFALKKQDARFLDLYGDTVGDVVFCFADEFGAQHGPQLPSARWGMGDLRGLFVLAGPGIKKGHVLERNVSLKDLVPTVCHLMELPVPRDCEGAILYQALEDPDALAKERARLQRHVNVLTGVAESEAAMTHTYHKAEG
jgi:predicted AlkP superfamily phosphohydrolase/phosphomutase